MKVQEIDKLIEEGNYDTLIIQQVYPENSQGDFYDYYAKMLDCEGDEFWIQFNYDDVFSIYPLGSKYIMLSSVELRKIKQLSKEALKHENSFYYER